MSIATSPRLLSENDVSNTDPVAHVPEPVEPVRGRSRFRPLCLHCGYDLSATPDGKCPECGAAFTYEELRQAFAVRAGFSSPSTRLLRVVMWTGLTTVPLCLGSAYGPSFVAIACWMYAAFAYPLRKFIAHTPWRGTVYAFASGSLASAVCMMLTSTTHQVAQAPLGVQLLIGAMLLTLAFSIAWGGLRWMLASLGGLALGVASFPSTDALVAIIKDDHWSRFAAVPWWRPPAHRSLSNMDTLQACIAIVCVGGALIGLAWLWPNWLWRKRSALTQSPSPAPSSPPCPPGSAPPSHPPPEAP